MEMRRVTADTSSDLDLLLNEALTSAAFTAITRDWAYRASCIPHFSCWSLVLVLNGLRLVTVQTGAWAMGSGKATKKNLGIQSEGRTTILFLI